MFTGTLLILASLSFPQADAPSAEVVAQVRQFVDDFESPQKAKRDAAEAGLMELGLPALVALPKLDDQASAEARQRLARVRTALEQLAAVKSIETSTVTLQGSFKFSDVLQKIRQQTGNPIVDYRRQFGQQPDDANIEVNFSKTPFWKAVDQLLDQTKLTLYNHTGEEGIGIVGRSDSLVPRVGSAQYVGAFRVAPVDLSARRDLRDTNGRSLQLTLEVAWEPRLKPVVLLQPMGKTKAIDEQGRTINTTHTTNTLELNVQAGSKSLEVPIQFALPERSSRKIAQLDGELTALVPGKAEEFRFMGLDKPEKQELRRGSVTVTIDRVAKNNQVHQVFIRVTFDRGEGALESHRTWILNNEAWLENAAGEKTAYAGLETTRQSENEVGLAYLFGVDDGLAGYTFVYRTPATIARLPIAFQLKDLELP